MDPKIYYFPALGVKSPIDWILGKIYLNIFHPDIVGGVLSPVIALEHVTQTQLLSIVPSYYRKQV